VYPNPFNPAKAVGKVLKFENVPPASRIRIFTVTGELVCEFQNVEGRQFWNGENALGGDVSSGIYLYVISLQNNEKVIGKIFLCR